MLKIITSKNYIIFNISIIYLNLLIIDTARNLKFKKEMPIFTYSIFYGTF